MSPRIQCSKFREWVDDLVGKDLRPERTAAAVAHARACLPCARLWKAAAERSAALSSLRPESLEEAGVRTPAPGTTADAVFARLASGEGAERWTSRWSRRVAAAAVLLASAVAGYQWTQLEESRSGELLNGPVAAGSFHTPQVTPVAAGRGRELRPMDDPTPTFYRNRQVGLDAPSVNTAPLFYEGKEFFRNPAGGFIPVSTSLRPF